MPETLRAPRPLGAFELLEAQLVPPLPDTEHLPAEDEPIEELQLAGEYLDALIVNAEPSPAVHTLRPAQPATSLASALRLTALPQTGPRSARAGVTLGEALLPRSEFPPPSSARRHVRVMPAQDSSAQPEAPRNGPFAAAATLMVVVLLACCAAWFWHRPQPAAAEVPGEAGPTEAQVARILTARTGFAVTTEPAGAGIQVDGKLTGQLSPDRVNGLAPGLHSIELKLDGFYDTNLTAVLEEGSILVLPPVQLRPLPTARAAR